MLVLEIKSRTFRDTVTSLEDTEMVHRPNTDPIPTQHLQWQTQHVCDWLFTCHLQGNAVSRPASCPHWGGISVLCLRAPPTSARHRHGDQHHLSVTCTGAPPPHANRTWWVDSRQLWCRLGLVEDFFLTSCDSPLPDHMILPVSLVYGHVTITTGNMTFYDCGAVSRLNQSSQ